MKKILQSIVMIASLMMIQFMPIKAQDTVAETSDTQMLSESTFSTNALLINLNDDRVMFEKNSTAKIYPASITKVMTAMVALEHISDMKETVTISDEMLAGLLEADASVAGFEIGEVVSNDDLLHGLLMPSGADAARALAIKTAGSEEAFVTLMNEKAKQLGMKDTHFVNTTGLHDDNHYSTCVDLAKMLKEAIKDERFLSAYTARTYKVPATNKHERGLELQSSLRTQIRREHLEDNVIEGAKTGFTSEAGMCLASTAWKDDVHYLLINVNAGSDNTKSNNVIDAYTLYSYFFRNFENRLIAAKGDELQRVKVKWNFDTKEFIFQAPKDIYAVVPMNVDKRDIEFRYVGEKIVETPIKKGQLLGEIQVRLQNQTIKSLSFEAPKKVDKNSLLYYYDMTYTYLSTHPGVLIGIGVALLILIVVLVWRKKSKQYF